MSSFKFALATAAFLAGMGLLTVGRAQAPAGAPEAPVARDATRQPTATQAAILGATLAGSRVVAVGDHGVVLLSDDGGQQFRQAKQVPVDSTLTSVSFVDAKEGWAVGHWGAILHTSDGGETWRTQRLATQEDRPLFSVHFFDARVGVAVGLWSLVLKTEDGGQTWVETKLPVPEGSTKADANLWSLFTNAQGQLFAAAERGLVLRSDDRGSTWRWLKTGYAGSFWTGVSPQPGTLLMAGLRGSLYRSVDDGASWQAIQTGNTRSVTTLLAQGARVEGLGLDGLRLHSDDGGAHFKVGTDKEHASLTAGVIMPNGRLVLMARSGVLPPAAP